DVVTARRDIKDFDMNKATEKRQVNAVHKETSEMIEKIKHLSSTSISLCGDRLPEDTVDAIENEIDDNVKYMSKHLNELRTTGVNIINLIDAQIKLIDELTLKANVNDSGMVDK
ncbi:hypothetical protein ROZALSC1DRAFT_23495, partial [Rozella allomycis CSF55]